jgi:tetratricopeptide (TPR) repeat protein
MGRNLERRGQNHAAAQVLNRLAACRELPDAMAEETHLRLAELHLHGGDLKRARRELTAALAYGPDNAHYHFLMAGAVEDDDACDLRRALWHYRQCTKLEPGNAYYWCAWGLLASRQGKTAAGLRALRRAHALAPDNHEILGQVALGLRDQGEFAEAEKLLRASLFRNSRAPRFRDLWTDHQYQMLHARQRETSRPARARSVILRFQRPAPQLYLHGNKRIRHDLPATPSGPSCRYGSR